MSRIDSFFNPFVGAQQGTRSHSTRLVLPHFLAFPKKIHLLSFPKKELKTIIPTIQIPKQKKSQRSHKVTFLMLRLSKISRLLMIMLDILRTPILPDFYEEETQNQKLLSGYANTSLASSVRQSAHPGHEDPQQSQRLIESITWWALT